jgi:magnesium-transporting ATPase (P-type)
VVDRGRPLLDAPGRPPGDGRGTATGRSLSGLTVAEVAVRSATDGPNVLPTPTAVPGWRLFAHQLVHFFALMLWAAAALALVAGLQQLAVAIAFVVVANATFSFVQEHRAEQATRRLRDLLPQRVQVRRDGGPMLVDAADVVRDDVLLLTSGDRVPADADVVVAHGLRVDESTLTGESVPVTIEPEGRVLAGCFVVEGEGEAIVSAVGAGTRLAQIAQLTSSAERPPSPLALELDRVVRTIAAIAVTVGVVFASLSVLLGDPLRDAYLFGIGVTVALVPEGLLPTVTLSLAIGAQRLAGEHALVRHLEAVETLGSTTVICTDKTGTLTLNQMTVVEVWTPEGSLHIDGPGYGPVAELRYDTPDARAAVERLALAAARASTGAAVERDGHWVPVGDPMEVSVDVLARRVGVDVGVDRTTRPDRVRFPFDPRRRRMSVIAGTELVLKGAPDSVLPACAPNAPAQDALERLAVRGLRVLAVARRELGDSPGPISEDADAVEQDLELLGLVALHDPPRLGTKAALAACRRAGVAVVMVTGDHPATAKAIAEQVGLLLPGAPVVEGAALPEADDDLGRVVDHDGAVICRVTPEDKLRIARALHARGHVVAMTGDGVNDGPALRQADIGVAMGASGTDVARAASDLVLLDDRFETIVAAIAHGRSTFANVRRFLTYHLTDNVAELTPFVAWALTGGRFPLALGVLQILALDLCTDTMSAVALGAEHPAPHVLDGPPDRRRLLDSLVARRAFVVLGPTEAFVAMAAFVASFLAAGWRPGDAFPDGAPLLAASGAAFLAVVAGQRANAFACRSTSRPPWAVGWRTNPLLLIAAAAELMLAAAFVGVPPLADLLDHATPPLAGWAVVALAPVAVLAVDAIDKAQRRRRDGRRRNAAAAARSWASWQSTSTRTHLPPP